MTEAKLRPSMRFYHNPRCSKSRQAHALLEERGAEVEVIRYLETGIHEEDLPVFARLENIVRKKEAGPEVVADVRAEEGPAAPVRYADVVVTHPIAWRGDHWAGSGHGIAAAR